MQQCFIYAFDLWHKLCREERDVFVLNVGTTHSLFEAQSN